MASSAPVALSNRERETLGHLAEGLTHASIARRMNLSPHTVDTYLRRIREKTGARNRIHLLRLALALSETHEESPRSLGETTS
ncbi:MULTISPECIES: helix-turn-helix transcriptional regulator [unclassified Streptomyces]|uniref:response regulator transcription factor n=1 Tax=unclassified Streptomyces TaxID=2593676 RepID=UPI000DBAD5C1|nr:MULTISPECIES: helix-turn-helix transcriptional regulator [unclassified Streptomyces]MYT68230.1 LuxR family transcriptional regulator [Streptomyces sp. SID8367]RAJ76862.1 regulatory LuxR family protein [Streptomyces sp. PsTaAH-137]